MTQSNTNIGQLGNTQKVTDHVNMNENSKMFEIEIHFIRHGESEFNVVANSMNLPTHCGFVSNCVIIDAPLSDKGKKQALELQTKVKNLNIDYIIVSPLKRALQTAIIAFPPSKYKF